MLVRLESCLPPHLRSDSASHAMREEVFVPDALRTAKLAFDADEQFNGLIPWLAVDQGRWKAAVWIVKLLIEHFHAESPRSTRLTHTIQEWNRHGSLDELTDNPLYLVPHQSKEAQLPHINPSSAASLHELTDDKPDAFGASETLRHTALGLVWRGIGRLIIACTTDHNIADGGVRPEILEMIALLHHYELMPSSIYTYVPAGSADAIQQPPTLHLLSSRIFTALSDATWKAREMTAVEEAKKKGGDPMGLEAKGSSYRVRVSGIKPEIWLELILWSCLHGGWILEGSLLLGSLHRSKTQPQWKPISWRDSLKAIMPSDRHESLDWDSIKYMFDNRSNSTMDDVDMTGLRVDKTISSEVVNAYIDVQLNIVNVGVGDRGVSLSYVMQSLHELRLFLQRADLNLGGGSWDAMILRLVESVDVDVAQKSSIIRRLVHISPRIGEELSSRRSQVLPSYVLDGSAAILGLLHRAIYAEIKDNNLEGALKVFRLLQERVDDDRHRSLRDFFEHTRLHGAGASAEPSWKRPFTSNFSGIDYPSLETQIPPGTLAAFLELVTENKAFTFGKWMLNNRDVDGPIVPDRLYSEPAIAAAIVRFATAANDTELLSKVVKRGSVEGEDGKSMLPNELLQAFLTAQIGLKRWDAAARLLEYMRDMDGFAWSVNNAAALAKIMIAEVNTRDSSEDFAQARDLFAAMLKSQYGDVPRDTASYARLNTLCLVFSKVDEKFAAYVHQLRKTPHHQNFTLGVQAFNSILEGVVLSQGSKAGRFLVNTFLAILPFGIDKHGKPKQKTSARMPRFLQDAAAASSLPKKTIQLANPHSPKVAVYGGLKFGPSTMQIICSQALRESSEDPAQKDLAFNTFVWAIFTLRLRGIDQTPVWGELLAGGLTSEDLKAIRAAVSEKIKALGYQADDSEQLADQDATASQEEERVVEDHARQENASNDGNDSAIGREAARFERFV